MKYPKNRGNIYHVVRHNYDSAGRLEKESVVIGSFQDYGEADNFAGAMEQEWREKLGKAANCLFRVEMGTYYG